MNACVNPMLVSMIVVMISRCLAIALLVVGCGEVARTPGDASHADGSGGQPDSTLPDAPMPVTYHGGPVTQTAPFGGVVYCKYTITLKDVTLDLDILPSGQLITGTVKGANVEGGAANCPLPFIPPNMASYTLQSAVPNGATTKLTFQGASGNVPRASLVVDLSRNGASYLAMMTFQRTDQVPELNWKVVVPALPVAAR
jgi:hypothetical protein